MINLTKYSTIVRGDTIFLHSTVNYCHILQPVSLLDQTTGKKTEKGQGKETGYSVFTSHPNKGQGKTGQKDREMCVMHCTVQVQYSTHHDCTVQYTDNVLARSSGCLPA
jgi:hypothetical protein